MITLNINIQGERLVISHENKVLAKPLYTPERLHQLLQFLSESYIDYRLIEEE